tara:strand:- start:8448 stop:9416 length:969 start_codon:yes stop_codon:yes gene_type:complete
MTFSVDIFSRFIDNYGDISIPLRLAHGLYVDHGVTSNVFLTSNELVQKILDKNLFNENINIIDIAKTDNNFLPNTNIVTIFDTQLPISYEAKLTNKNLLINYEYFSAEQWVDDYHLKESINKKYKKIFYIPGVSEHSGAPIFAINDNGLYGTEKLKDTNTINFFCYFNNKIEASIKVLRTNFPQYECVLHDQFYKDKSRGKNLLSFNDFDKALSNSLINFVRGEDSLIRAILAGSPFIWQPYIQENGLHNTKLNAFLDHYFISLPPQLREFFLIWNNQSLNLEHWQYILKSIENLKDCYLDARQNFIKRGTGIAQINSLFIK